MLTRSALPGKNTFALNNNSLFASPKNVIRKKGISKAFTDRPSNTTFAIV